MHAGRQRRSLYGAVLIAIGMAMGVALPVASAASPPHIGGRRTAAAPPSYSLFAGAAALRSSTKQSLLLSLDANSSSFGGSTATEGLDVYLYKETITSTTNLRGQSEDYSFVGVPASVFKVSGSGKTVTKATLSMGAVQWGSQFGSFTLTFTPTKFTNEKCTNAAAGNYERVYTGNLAGRLTFDTSQGGAQPSKWGKVAGANVSFNALKSTSTVTVDNGCEPVIPPSKNYCISGVSFESPTTATKVGKLKGTESIGAGAYTSNGQTSGEIFAERSVTLAGLPKGANGQAVTGTRGDEVYELTNFPVAGSVSPAKPNPMRVTAGPSPAGDTLFSGSATGSTTKSGHYSTPCTLNSQKGAPTKTETGYSSFVGSSQAPISWTNGSSKLTGVVGVGSNIVIANHTDGGTSTAYWGNVSVTTYK